MQVRSTSTETPTVGSRFQNQSGGFFAAAATLLCGILLTGCSETMQLHVSSRTGPFYSPTNYVGDKALPAGLHRIVVLPVFGGQVANIEASQVLDEILAGALQKKARFEVVVVSREEIQRRFSQPEFSSAAVLPHGFMEELSKAYGADAVLFVDITHYQPYPPLSVGFRAKLATVQDVRLIWAFDETFSSVDPAIVNSVERSDHRSGSRSPVDMTVGVLQSPRRFAAYAADAMFDTIPPR